MYFRHNDGMCTAHARHEQLKRRHYDQRVREVEHGTFTPLVFATSGGLGKSAETTYKCLASLIAEKRDADYATIRKWRISFSLLRSAITCLRGARSSRHTPRRDLDPVVSEGRLSL